MTYFSNIPIGTENRTLRLVFFTVFLILAAAWCYLLWVAKNLAATPFDTYEIYINAKIFSGLDHFVYHWKRPPLLSWLLQPFFYFFSLETAKTASQILAVFFYGALTLGSYKVFRLFWGPLKALLGTSLLALNPLILHHAPFLKEDIPASALATLAFWLYLRSRSQEKVLPYALTGLVIALAGSARYNMLPWMLPAIAFYELLSVLPWPLSWKNLTAVRIHRFGSKTFFLIIFPAVLVLLFISISWTAATQTKGLSAFTQPLQSLWTLFSKLLGSGDSPLENLFFLWNAFTGPAIVLCAIGIFVSWFRKVPGSLWMNLWLLAFTLQQLSLTHHEARYLFPVFPPIVFFIITGASAFFSAIRNLSRKMKLTNTLSSWLGVACLAPCFFLYGYASAAELVKFQDPLYRAPFMKTVSNAAATLAGEKNIFWVGKMYPLHPKQFVFHPNDECGYIYHFYNHTVRFYTGKFVTVIALDNKRLYEKGRRLFLREGLRQIEDGDVLIINPNPASYNTINLPEKILPLFVQKCRVIEFTPGEKKDGKQLFTSKNTRGSLQSGEKNHRLQVDGMGLPDGSYELYARERTGTEPYWVDTVSVKNGQFSLNTTSSRNVSSYFLLTYTTPISFPHP